MPEILSKKIGNRILAVIPHGKNITEALDSLIARYEIKSGLIVYAIGMLSDIKLGYFVGNGKYQISDFRDPAELVAFHGNISRDEEGNVIKHIHCGVALKDKTMRGGHLVDAKAWAVVELVIDILPDDTFIRKYNPSTGLKGLNIR